MTETNNTQYRRIREQHRLTATKVIKLLQGEYYLLIDGQKIGPFPYSWGRVAVESWAYSPESEGFRPMPDLPLAILKAKLSTHSHEAKRA